VPTETKSKADPTMPYREHSILAIMTEAGARHSAVDTQMLQTIHDHATALGATCATSTKEAGTSELDGDAVPLVESVELTEIVPLVEEAA
jgi:hypothetical protein